MKKRPNEPTCETITREFMCTWWYLVYMCAQQAIKVMNKMVNEYIKKCSQNFYRKWNENEPMNETLKKNCVVGTYVPSVQYYLFIFSMNMVNDD